MDIRTIDKIKFEIARKKQAQKPTGRTVEELTAEAQAIDESKKYKRKTLTKAEQAEADLQAFLNYNHEEPEVKKETTANAIVHNPNALWDVPIDQPIEYFDPTLSYELTGYRPITETEGLDFDPKEFTKAADYYRQHKRYTDFIPGTFSHLNHWKTEFEKCRNGITIGKYRLTGEHYFFLNYYRLLSVLGKNKEEIRDDDFPGFMAKQYEYFHYLEMARKTGHDACIFKCRGVGHSEAIASNLAHGYTFHKASKSIVSAAAQNYVDTTLAKCWQELDFLNTCTEGGFKRLRMKVDTAMRKRASRVDKDKNETGWMAEIEGVVTDNPRKLRGSRVYSLFFEEAGSFPGLVDTYIQARALVDILGYRIGMRILGGTGGDSGPQLAGLNQIFYHPEEFSILPYKHNYTQDGSTQLTGFFIPSYEMWFGDEKNPGFDSRGVVDKERAKKYYIDKWAKIKDPKLLAKDKAEYCFTPEDAFILEGSNRFDTEILVDQLHALTIHKTIPLPKPAVLHWGRNDEGQVDRDSKPRIEFCSSSPLHIMELPMLDPNGIPYNNLYCIGCDSIDADSTTSTGQTDVSQFCVVVMKRAFGTEPQKIVAIYKERPKHIQIAFDNALKLCQFYNAKLLYEATRVSIKTHFERYHKLSYLMRRPSATANTTTKTNLRQYGCPAPEHVIQHYLDLIEQYVVDAGDTICFPEAIDELMRYSYEKKRKFDIVAALGMALLACEEMLGYVARPSVESGTALKMGYVRNQYGQMELKVINNGTTSGTGTSDSGLNLLSVRPSVQKPFGGPIWK